MCRAGAAGDTWKDPDGVELKSRPLTSRDLKPPFLWQLDL